MPETAPADGLTPIDDVAGRTVYYDARAETYHVWCGGTDYEPVSTTLIVVLSSLFGVEPDELEPLSTRVDSDALNALVGHWFGEGTAPADASVSFSFADCAITVRADGEIAIDPGPSLEPR